jgi:hypothetical protein
MRDAMPSRRRFVAATAGIVAGTGCAGGSDGDRSTTADPTTTDSTAADTRAPLSDGPELDRREANVVDVEFERDGTDYTFDVTLHHDDDGEEGYANWWQVERLDGDRLGRRDLLHAHSQQPFTRSDTVAIPEAVTCVVVRGHDQTHGYGGRLVVVDLDSGATTSVDQGADRQSVDASDCPSA